jgi:hypothetical protein
VPRAGLTLITGIFGQVFELLISIAYWLTGMGIRPCKGMYFGEVKQRI